MNRNSREAETSVTPGGLPQARFGARTWRLAKIGPTAVYLEASWPALLVLLAWTLASGHVATDQPGWPTWQRWAAGVLTGVLYFLVVLLQCTMLRSRVRPLMTTQKNPLKEQLLLQYGQPGWRPLLEK